MLIVRESNYAEYGRTKIILGRRMICIRCKYGKFYEGYKWTNIYGYYEYSIKGEDEYMNKNLLEQMQMYRNNLGTILLILNMDVDAGNTLVVTKNNDGEYDITNQDIQSVNDVIQNGGYELVTFSFSNLRNDSEIGDLFLIFDTMSSEWRLVKIDEDTSKSIFTPIAILIESDNKVVTDPTNFILKSSVWINKKTKGIYYVEDIVMNATNRNDGDLMVLYCEMDVTHDEGIRRYVRSIDEFLEKFDAHESVHITKDTL